MSKGLMVDKLAAVDEANHERPHVETEIPVGFQYSLRAVFVMMTLTGATLSGLMAPVPLSVITALILHCVLLVAATTAIAYGGGNLRTFFIGAIIPLLLLIHGFWHPASSALLTIVLRGGWGSTRYFSSPVPDGPTLIVFFTILIAVSVVSGLTAIWVRSAISPLPRPSSPADGS